MVVGWTHQFTLSLARLIRQAVTPAESGNAASSCFLVVALLVFQSMHQPSHERRLQKAEVWVAVLIDWSAQRIEPLSINQSPQAGPWLFWRCVGPYIQEEKQIARRASSSSPDLI